jgi:dUTP pyrophosphatase
MMQQINEEILKKIQEQIDKIKQETGVEPDEKYQEELDDFFGLNYEQFDDLDKEIVDLMRRQTVEVELVSEDAIFPSYAYPTDSGFDLHSTNELEVGPFGRVLVPTGIKLSFGEGYEIQVRPKSGLAIKQGLTVLNTPGTVDQGYTGEIQVIVFNTNNYAVTIPKGMKIAQAVLCPVMNGKFVLLKEVENVKDKDRGDNGFGSTGL